MVKSAIFLKAGKEMPGCPAGHLEIEGRHGHAGRPQGMACHGTANTKHNTSLTREVKVMTRAMLDVFYIVGKVSASG